MRARRAHPRAWWPWKQARPEAATVAGDAEDFLVITWDSCRYDAFVQARKPVLDGHGPARQAWAMGTYRLPAHMALFHGFLPHAFVPEPFYNRHVRQLWRIRHGRVRTLPLATFPAGTPNIVTGLREQGYATLGVAAMTLFRDTAALREGFEEMAVPGIDARKQNRAAARLLWERAAARPCFLFVNYGETHSPFHHADMPASERVEEHYSLEELFNQPGVKSAGAPFDVRAFVRMVSCAEFLDARTGELLELFRARGRPTTVVVCADHGECLGEEGLYGHAFYHEKVMEVPLLIFRLNAPAHTL
jgi:hypothetical protein